MHSFYRSIDLAFYLEYSYYQLPNRTCSLNYYSLLALMFLASLSYNVLSHSGRSDNQGGHFNRSTNQYHCHKEPCFSTHEQSKSALQDANDSNRAYSIVYNRTDWPHWIDEDKDCQNTRAEILIYHSAIPVTFQKDNHCTVKSGRWTGVYTGQVFTNASDIDIDHIVPLAHAHRNGAERRKEPLLMTSATFYLWKTTQIKVKVIKHQMNGGQTIKDFGANMLKNGHI